jgi:hypothetical protein
MNNSTLPLIPNLIVKMSLRRLAIVDETYNYNLAVKIISSC